MNKKNYKNLSIMQLNQIYDKKELSNYLDIIKKIQDDPSYVIEKESYILAQIRIAFTYGKIEHAFNLMDKAGFKYDREMEDFSDAIFNQPFSEENVTKCLILAIERGATPENHDSVIKRASQQNYKEPLNLLLSRGALEKAGEFAIYSINMATIQDSIDSFKILETYIKNNSLPYFKDTNYLQGFFSIACNSNSFKIIKHMIKNKKDLLFSNTHEILGVYLSKENVSKNVKKLNKVYDFICKEIVLLNKQKGESFSYPKFDSEVFLNKVSYTEKSKKDLQLFIDDFKEWIQEQKIIFYQNNLPIKNKNKTFLKI